MDIIYDLIIIGSGPAAHTAAIYAGRAQLKVLMLEGEMAGGIPAGGQLTTTTEIENFPGFPDAISGFELMQLMRQQSEKFLVTILTKTADKLKILPEYFEVFSAENVFKAKSLIIATGATAKRLHLPGEDQFWQKGISACAVCDGGLPIFRNKHLLVIGGGDTAAEEALFLTKFTENVTMIIRRDVMRASKIMQDRVFLHKSITVMWNTIPLEVVGDGFFSGLKVKNKITEEESLISAQGMFYAIGHQPNTLFLENQLKLDSAGYIETIVGTTKTSVSGIFACGDVQDKIYRQAIVAAGSGCMAALTAQQYLAEREK